MRSAPQTWLGESLLRVAVSVFLLQACRSETSAASRNGTSAPGALQSAPVVLPADDGTTAYKLPSAQRTLDAAHRTLSDGGLSMLPPVPLREDSRVPADTLSSRDVTGVTLETEWKASDWPAPAISPETDREKLNELRNATRWLARIDLLSSGRMRMVLRGRGYALEGGTELRARVDLLGHYLVWPNESEYRAVPPGALRPLFEDGRADVGELVPIQGEPAGSGHVLEWDTERASASTSFGQVTIDRAAAFNVGVAGRLVCRWLVEFINADPASEFCQDDAVPVRAVFEFSGGGKGEFVVTRVLRRQEFSTSSVSVPPATATPNLRALPRGAPLSGPRLAGLRTRATSSEPRKPDSPATGLLASNHSLGLRALLVDGVVVGWLWPGEELRIPELLAGTYSVVWRDFLGISRETPANITLPAHVTLAAGS